MKRLGLATCFCLSAQAARSIRGFVFEAKNTGAHAVELNLKPSEGADLFDERLHGPATAVVPMYVETLLAG